MRRVHGVVGDSRNRVVEAIRRTGGRRAAPRRPRPRGPAGGVRGQLRAPATGMCNVWTARYVTPNGRRRILGSFKHGSMANALPHAIGAQLAAPDRQVIAMAGDGGLAMLLGEPLTLRTHRLPMKVVVLNNSSLGMVKLEMLVEGFSEYETNHDPVDFATIARGADLFGRRVEKPGEVTDGIREVLAEPGPVLLDLVVDTNALSTPPTVTTGQVRGFALAVSRTVLEGGVGRMLSLARSNMCNTPDPDPPPGSTARGDQPRRRRSATGTPTSWHQPISTRRREGAHMQVAPVSSRAASAASSAGTPANTMMSVATICASCARRWPVRPTAQRPAARSALSAAR